MKKTFFYLSVFLAIAVLFAYPGKSIAGTSDIVEGLGEGNISSGDGAVKATGGSNAENSSSGESKVTANQGVTGGEKVTASSTGTASSKFGGVMPSKGKITSNFGMRKHPVKKVRKMHTGIDIGVPKGTPIYAIGDGVVVESKVGTGYGNYILVKHEIDGKTYYTRYAHLSKRCPVGTKVGQGEVIPTAKSGNSGISSGAHLHFEVLDEAKKAIDPMDFIASN